MLQKISRKLLMGFGGSFGDTLNREDPSGDGLLSVEKVKSLVVARGIQALQPSELDFVLANADKKGYGFIIIQKLHEKLLEHA